MHVIELGKGESNQAQKYHPGLPSIELVVAVHDGADKKFDSALGDQKRVCGEDATDTSEEHPSDKTKTRSGTRV
jgi:hypothetical protein